MLDSEDIKKLIVDVPDFPKQGIVFKDIHPVLQNGEAFRFVIEWMVEQCKGKEINQVVAIESRGFIFGAALASRLKTGLTLVRKPGKLPRKTVRQEYQLEYGTDALEVHADALSSNNKIVIVDDVLATGGTASATESLCKKLGAVVVQNLFLIELDFLNGSKRLSAPVCGLLHF